MNIDRNLALDAINRIKSNLEISSNEMVLNDLNVIESLIEKSNSDYEYLSIIATSMNKRITIKLLPFDVAFIESDGRYTTFKAIDGSTYISSRTSIQSIEDVWDGYFVRVGRGVLVNPTKIVKVVKEKDGHLAVLINNLGNVSVSRRQIKIIKERI